MTYGLLDSRRSALNQGVKNCSALEFGRGGDFLFYRTYDLWPMTLWSNDKNKSGRAKKRAGGAPQPDLCVGEP